MNGYDERDTIFSRMELQPGSPNYKDYYSRQPQRRTADDLARTRQPRFADRPELRRLVDASFSLLEDLRPLARGSVAPEAAAEPLQPEAGEATAFLKRLAESYGAVLFGCGPLGEACFYHTRGRGSEYGQAVEVPGKVGLVYAVRMDPAQIAKAPAPEAAAEVVNAYTRVALIGLVLARCLRAWGYPAACTMDGRADLVLPVAARYVGLGSIGRSGLLLSDEYGPCIRLGAVLTNMPLARTERSAGRAARLCASCTRCAQACPAGAIDPALGSGQFKPVNDDACFAQWQEFGTDCGLCLAVCPHSTCPQASAPGGAAQS